MTKTLASVLAVFVLVAAPAGVAAADLKIGYIIIPRLLAETQVGKVAARELRGKKDAMQQELDGKLAEIKDFEADVHKRATVLSEAERKRAGEELETQVREAKRLQEDFQRSLQRAEAGVMGRVNQELQQVIRAHSADGDYDLVIDSSVLLHASGVADITDAVIEAADKAFEAGKGR